MLSMSKTHWSALFLHTTITIVQLPITTIVFLVYLSQQHCESHSLVAEFGPKCDVPIKLIAASMFGCLALRFSVYQWNATVARNLTVQSDVAG